MRQRRWLIPIFALALLAGACGDDDGGDADADDGGGDGDTGAQVEDDTGSVNLLSAVEPEEGEAVQAIFDEMINSETEYTAEIESSGTFEEQLPIRAEGGTLDLAAVPQPGTVVEMASSR